MFNPDPVLTASIYCNGRLDRVIHEVAAPVVERLRSHGSAVPWLLWWVRYSRNGDHLKLRLHGPEAARDSARETLQTAATAFFEELPPPDPAEPRVSRRFAPPIDMEDHAETDYPDRTLLWTEYRRSHVSFGPKPLLGDDGYVARITACLGRSAEMVLNGTSLDANRTVPGRARQRTLLKALIVGLRAMGFDAAERARYLAYHRDWLVRFSVADRAAEEGMLQGFNRQVAGMPGTLEQLRRATAAEWGQGEQPRRGDTPETRWADAVAELGAYAAPMRRAGGPCTDPYTDDAAFPLLFKSFHGAANQVGLDVLNEAFLHHLLVRVADGAEAPVAVGA